MADYWRVNSYGYPNPFSDDVKHVQAWQTLETFYEYTSYASLKKYWSSSTAPRALSSHAVESWKATFEEFGLLYVPRGSDQIRVTPAGHQFRAAAVEQNQVQWVWIGLNLILRYPLRGPRGSRKGEQGDSDLLPYWYLYAAMRELSNYIWFAEIERVIGTTIRREDAAAAVRLVKRLRAGEVDISSVPLPVSNRRGQFYNSLNQVPNHASLGYTIFDKTSAVAHYDEPRGERRHELVSRWLPLLDLALGNTVSSTEDADCSDSGAFIERMPSAPDFGGDEDAYFEYLGAAVGPVEEVAGASEGPRLMPFGQGTVAVLRPGADYTAQGDDVIVGPIGCVCRLAREQRVILAHDLSRTYKVLDKHRRTDGLVEVRVRRARPISDPTPIEAFLQEDNA